MAKSTRIPVPGGIAAPNRCLTVYPPRWCDPIIGRGASIYNYSIACWSRVLDDAIAANADLFTAKEWALLRSAIEPWQFDPQQGLPAASICTILDKPALLNKGSDSLIAKVGPLEYVRSWALVFVCKFREDKGQWWMPR